MVLLGTLGVVAATAMGQLVAVYMLHDVRRSVRRDLPNPLRHVPLARGAAAALTFGLEVAIRPYLPVGAVGLLGAGVPALIGLGVFAVLMLGPRRAARIAARPCSSPHRSCAIGLSCLELPIQVSMANEYQPKHSKEQVPSLPQVRSQ